MAFLFKNSCVALVLLSYVITSLFPSVSAQTYATATYYTPPYMPSACYGFQDQGVMIAAASEAIYNNGAACGQFYQLNCLSGTNPGTPFPCQGSGTVVAKIVDRCRGCRSTIDLSQEAFASAADTASGVINISYQQI